MLTMQVSKNLHDSDWMLVVHSYHRHFTPSKLPGAYSFQEMYYLSEVPDVTRVGRLGIAIVVCFTVFQDVPQFILQPSDDVLPHA